MERLEVAKVLKPQGIKGELKFKVLLNDINDIKKYNNFVLGTKAVSVKSVRVDNNFAYILFNEISKIEEAETYRNKSLYLEKEEKALEDGEFFIEDMIGKTCIFEDGTILGELSDIQNFGSADVYYVNKENGKEVLFSFVEGVIIEVDENKIVLNKKRFDEVSV